MLTQFRQRAMTVLQREGVPGLMKRAARRLRRRSRHYSRFVFRCSLNHPIHPPLPKVEVGIRQPKATDDEDLETLVQIDPWPDSKALLQRRLAEGQRCYVARYRGQIVAGGWCVSGEYYDRELGRQSKLATNEICFHSGFTIPAFRGEGVYPFSPRNVPAMSPGTRTKPTPWVWLRSLTGPPSALGPKWARKRSVGLGLLKCWAFGSTMSGRGVLSRRAPNIALFKECKRTSSSVMYCKVMGLCENEAL